jgi:hypothetical protein
MAQYSSGSSHRLFSLFSNISLIMTFSLNYSLHRIIIDSFLMSDE